MIAPNIVTLEERRRWTTCQTLCGTSDDSGVKGAACDYWFMGDAVEGDAMNELGLTVCSLTNSKDVGW